MSKTKRTNWKFTIKERKLMLGLIDKKEKAKGEMLQTIQVLPCLKMYLFNSNNKDELYKKLIAYALKEAVIVEDRLSSNAFPERSYPTKARSSILDFLGIDRKRYYRWIRMVEGDAPGRQIAYAHFPPLLELYRRVPGVKLASSFRMIQAIWPEFLNYCMHESEVPTRGDVANSSNLIFHYDPQRVTEQQVADSGMLVAFVWVKQLCALLRQVVEECDSAEREPRWHGEEWTFLHRKFFVDWGVDMLDLPHGKDRIELVRVIQKEGKRLVSCVFR